MPKIRAIARYQIVLLHYYKNVEQKDLDNEVLGVLERLTAQPLGQPGKP